MKLVQVKKKKKIIDRYASLKTVIGFISSLLLLISVDKETVFEIVADSSDHSFLYQPWRQSTVSFDKTKFKVNCVHAMPIYNIAKKCKDKISLKLTQLSLIGNTPNLG